MSNKKEAVLIVGGMIAVFLLTIFAVPVIGHALVAWEHYLSKVFGN